VLIHPYAAADAAWRTKRASAMTLVAEIDGEVIGFTDLLPDRLIDMVFVAPHAAHRGVASGLLTAVIESATEQNIAVLTTHASILARPGFGRLDRCGREACRCTIARREHTPQGL